MIGLSFLIAVTISGLHDSRKSGSACGQVL